MIPVRPNLNAFGNSFAHPNGANVWEGKQRGQIVTSALNKIELADENELTNFEKTVKNFILASLGAPVIRVELADVGIKTAIDLAVNKLNYHIPYWCSQYLSFTTTAGCNLYELPPYILDSLVYVGYRKNLFGTPFSGQAIEFDYFWQYFNGKFMFNDFTMGDFYLLQSHMEMTKRILSQDGTFDTVDGKYLQVYPVPVFDGEEIVVEYRALDSDTLQPAYKSWIDRYALAQAKGILGRTLSKFATLPSPAGGAKMDGLELRKESKEEIEMLEEELLSSIEEPPLPLWG